MLDEAAKTTDEQQICSTLTLNGQRRIGNPSEYERQLLELLETGFPEPETNAYLTWPALAPLRGDIPVFQLRIAEEEAKERPNSEYIERLEHDIAIARRAGQ